MNATVPVSGEAVIPVSSAQVSGIPAIALVIPDFEGNAVLRFFSNNTKSQVGCIQAVMRNGATMSHPVAVGSVLGFFTLIAIFASFAAVIYGASVPQIRTHYAHSLSVLVVFEVFQSIFFSGALSLNYPSICAGWWSNFAWSAGMIYSSSITSSLDKFIGVSGNSSQVGGAGESTLSNNGGLEGQIYGRSLAERAFDERSSETSEVFTRGLKSVAHSFKRAVASSTNSPMARDYDWAGNPVRPGLPLPGNWSNFDGTLSEVNVPVHNAFLTSFIWFIILVVILVFGAAAFKGSLELFSRLKWIKQDRLTLFRDRWLGFLGLIVLRSMFIAFFMVMALAMLQFSIAASAGALVVSVIIFLVFFAGFIGVSLYACFYRVKLGAYKSAPDRVHFQRTKVMKFIPWYKTAMETNVEEADKAKSSGSIPFFRVQCADNDSERQNVHQDEGFNKHFGWLSARYRRTRWWFFAFWVVYQFVRACFIGGGNGTPTVQVIGLFVWEFIAFITIIRMNPFEGARNTALAVYMLGISKVVTAGLSIAFLPQLNVARIPTTVLGVIIIVVQGFLVFGMLILIVLSAISSHMSLSRNNERISPRSLETIREKYFKHLEQKAADLPPSPTPAPEEPKAPYFNVNTVRREPKIEDDETLADPDLPTAFGASELSLTRGSRSNSIISNHYPLPPPIAGRASRAPSMATSIRSHASYGNLPYGARAHRASWSSRDFQNWQEEERSDAEASLSGLPTPVKNASGPAGRHSRSNSMGANTTFRYASASPTPVRPVSSSKEQPQRQPSGLRNSQILGE